MRFSVLPLAVLIVITASAPEVTVAQIDAPDWEMVTQHAAWAPRDSCGEVVYGGKMWLLGGWFSSNIIGPRDVYSSADGVNWDKVTQTAGWKHGDLPTTLVFKDKMWFMGGWYAGRLPNASASSQVWSSTDGAQWDCVTQAAGWSPRIGAAGVVFKDRMWVLGGVERYFDGDESHLRNDVWHSADGEHWECATAEAPWAGRAFHGALVFQDKIWVFGGGNYLPTYLGLNDVWNSSDGVHWTKVTDHAPWAARVWFSAVVYKGRMWILGGWSNDPSKNWNDVWYTADGVDWKRLKTNTIWSERHEHSAYVLDDAIWVAGGNEWPLVNDVWRLRVSDTWLEGN